MTEKQNRGRRMKDVDDLIENGKIGDFCFVEKENGDLDIWLRYPPSELDKGFPNVVRLPLKSEAGGLTWDFNGNMETPTLSPSIRIEGHWHGFLRAGVLSTCGDSPSNNYHPGG